MTLSEILVAIGMLGVAIMLAGFISIEIHEWKRRHRFPRDESRLRDAARDGGQGDFAA